MVESEGVRPPRVLLADDHHLFRRGLREVLEEDGDFQVVAEAVDGEEAVRLATALGTAGLDLVLLDLEMPKLGGVGALRQIRAAVPGLKIVVLTGSIQDQDLYSAVDGGAGGFLTKGLTPSALLRALHDYCRGGGLAMTRPMAAKAITHLQQQAQAVREASPVDPDSPDPPEPPATKPRIEDLLTPREREVAELVAAWATNRDIAEGLSISVYTAKEYVQNVIRKLGARNRADAAARYRELTS